MFSAAFKCSSCKTNTSLKPHSGSCLCFLHSQESFLSEGPEAEPIDIHLRGRSSTTRGAFGSFRAGSMNAAAGGLNHRDTHTQKDRQTQRTNEHKRTFNRDGDRHDTFHAISTFCKGIRLPSAAWQCAWLTVWSRLSTSLANHSRCA